ncbi:MAG TPA: gluconokinase [Candidatus Melainabacteria bacterium]|nr:gluconokinase [Candidatus Melainabacteria bacterium]
MPTVNSRAQILIVMGVSGSGKTTVGKALAAALGWSFIEGDQFHPKENIEKMAGGIPLTDSDRASWLEALRKQIESCLQQDKSAVLACSALKASYRSILQLDERVQFVFLNIPFEVARQRMTGRQGHFMPVALLESQFKTLQQPEGSDFINVDAQQAPDQIVKEVVAKVQN